MKAALHMKPYWEHHRVYGAAMRAGLERHGVEVLIAGVNEPQPCDFAVMWGWKQPAVIAAAPHVLLMEAPHLREGDPRRLDAASCGWDGLAGRGRYPRATDGGARWRARHGHLMAPWRAHRGYALLLGQIPGDAALAGLDVERWAHATCEALRQLGWGVVYRPHPLARGRGIPHARYSATAPLAQDLAGAGLCVVYNSTASVEAVLAGVPTVTIDPGAMAWPVAAHALDAPPITPDREPWAWDLAWTQWSLEEIAAGDAWAQLAPIMDGA